jgi:eukaryotic-like serine/threonine-protein kinase
MITVPSLEDRTLALARQDVGDDFELVSNMGSSDRPEGIIIYQDPKPGTKLEQGKRISVLVSTGQATIPIPAVGGETEAVAKIFLEHAGFEPTTTYRVSSGGDRGRVMEQWPSGEAEVSSTVEIVVGSGPAE